MADSKEIANRIAASAKDGLDDETISATIKEAMESPTVNAYLEIIVQNDDYAELYNAIFSAADYVDMYKYGFGEGDKLTDDVLKRIFRPDTLPDIMIDAVCAANGEADLDFIDKSLSIYNQSMKSGMDYVHSKMYAGDLLNCGSNGFTNMFSDSGENKEGITCLYSQEQVSVLSDLSDEIFEKAKDKREYFGKDKSAPSVNYLRDCLRDAMEYAGCFDNSLSPVQMEKAGDCVLHNVESVFWNNWRGPFTNEQLNFLKEKVGATIGRATDREQKQEQEKGNLRGKIEDNQKKISNFYEATNSSKPITNEKDNLNPKL